MGEGEGAVKVSIVIPVKDEEGSLRELYSRVCEALDGSNSASFEIIFVDDGSRDGSWREMAAIASADPMRVKALRLRRNFGKAIALDIGFQEARGDVIVTMDGDLQDDPAELPAFLAKIQEGYDLVSGWKQTRHDPLSKRLPSKLFNAVTSRLTGIPLHDFNCGFKAYRRDVLQGLRIYGELHRYIPVLANQLGFRIGEIAVRHHARKHGISKYGVERYVRGFLDLLTVLAITRYLQRPAHMVGGLGVLCGATGFLILSYLTAVWLFGHEGIGGRPLLFLGVLLVIVAVQLVSLGILGELILRYIGPSPVERHVVERKGH